MVAALQPKPAVRKLPSRKQVGFDGAVTAAKRSERYKVQFTMTRETRDRLRQVQGLISTSTRMAIPLLSSPRH